MTISLKLNRLAAAGFGSGWLPKAPGTWGSLAALLPGWFILQGAGSFGLLLAAVIVTLFGCYACSRVLPKLEEKDPGWIVIDEWAGQWLCLATASFGATHDLYLLLLSFAMFRLFDVLKPWPVSWLEKTGPEWWSIMADDLGAGLLGSAVVVLILRVAGGIV